MAIYESFNSDGVSVVVSDVDLDQVARDIGPLSTELVEHLHRSLVGEDRARKLAAAKALLALADRSAGALLESLAATQLARLLVSNYNSHLRLEAGDIRFPIAALRHYLSRSLPWLTKLRPDIWDNGVFLIVNALSNDGGVQLLRQAAPERSELLRLLAAVPEHTDDGDIVTGAKDLRAALSDGS